MQERRKLLFIVLTLLFLLNVINLVTSWDHTRYVFVLYDSSIETMYAAWLGFQIPGQIGDLAMVLCVFLSDFVLVRYSLNLHYAHSKRSFNKVWRCCILWEGNRWLIGSYGVIFLAHIGEASVMSIAMDD